MYMFVSVSHLQQKTAWEAASVGAGIAAWIFGQREGRASHLPYFLLTRLNALWYCNMFRPLVCMCTVQPGAFAWHQFKYYNICCCCWSGNGGLFTFDGAAETWDKGLIICTTSAPGGEEVIRFLCLGTWYTSNRRGSKALTLLFNRQ